MQTHAKVFSLPKQGSSAAEYEDASAIATDKFRFAVADGATETSFSGIWARQLVRAFANERLSIPIAVEELKSLQSRWQTIVHRHALSWYAEEKANDGAFAAFIGLELLEEDSEAGPRKVWRATAVGDSCLVQVRRNEIIKAFPLVDSTSFNDRPNLLCSLLTANGNGGDYLAISNGLWECDDTFFLMTDALACWFFKEKEQGNSPWNVLRDLDTQDGRLFEHLVADLRAGARIKNDDVTLLRIDVMP